MLADELARGHPGAAASLREGMQETLTVTRPGVRARLKRTLASTRPSPDQPQRQALSSGDMCLRWTAAAKLEAQRQFRKIIGYPNLAQLAAAVERDIAAKRAADTPTTRPHTSITSTAPEVAATSA